MKLATLCLILGLGVLDARSLSARRKNDDNVIFLPVGTKHSELSPDIQRMLATGEKPDEPDEPKDKPDEPKDSKSKSESKDSPSKEESEEEPSYDYEYYEECMECVCPGPSPGYGKSGKDGKSGKSGKDGDDRMLGTYGQECECVDKCDYPEPEPSPDSPSYESVSYSYDYPSYPSSSSSSSSVSMCCCDPEST